VEPRDPVEAEMSVSDDMGFCWRVPFTDLSGRPWWSSPSGWEKRTVRGEVSDAISDLKPG